MSFITPILMVPSLYCACAEPHPSTTASAVRLSKPFMWHSPCCRFVSRNHESHTEILVQLAEIGLKLGICELVDDATMFHDVIAVRNSRSEAKILLDQQNGEAL